jgi:hypothetical protein
MDGVLSRLVLTATLTAAGFYVLYAVIRRAVRAGIRDAATGSPATDPHEDMRR